MQPNLPSSSYTVVWRVVSAVDGHLTESSYAVTVLLPGEPTPTPGAEPTPEIGTQTLGGLDVGLTVRPDLAGNRFTVRLASVDAAPLITNGLRLQLKLTPQDVNAGSTLMPLTFAGNDGPALTDTATESILTLAGGYNAQVLISRRQGNDVKVAYRMTLDEQGGLTIATAPFVQVQVSPDPSPAISGTVQIDLRLSDGVGQPVEGALVNLLPLMPAHAHVEPQDPAQPVAGTPGLCWAKANMQRGGGAQNADHGRRRPHPARGESAP